MRVQTTFTITIQLILAEKTRNSIQVQLIILFNLINAVHNPMAQYACSNWEGSLWMGRCPMQ
jgi:hypothetical protein